MKVEEAKKVALKKHGRPRNVGGQHLKAKKEITSKTTKKKLEDLEALKEYSNGSNSEGKKSFGVKWKDFDAEMFIVIKGETNLNIVKTTLYIYVCVWVTMKFVTEGLSILSKDFEVEMLIAIKVETD